MLFLGLFWLALRMTEVVSSVPQALVLELPAYEGPLDVLLELAKTQKVDLAQISILALVDQYLAFVKLAKRQNLDLAADYLVMAAVLAYLKSRLLLPPPEAVEEEMDPAQAAALLALRLKRLNAMKEAGERLWNQPQLGQHRFATARKPVASITTKIRYTASLFDVLSAYAAFHTRKEETVLRVKKPKVFKFEQALERVQKLLNFEVPRWTSLQEFLPAEETPAMRRSALASTLLAGLELTKQGRLELRQDQAFGPLFLRPLSSEGNRS